MSHLNLGFLRVLHSREFDRDKGPTKGTTLVQCCGLTKTTKLNVRLKKSRFYRTFDSGS